MSSQSEQIVFPKHLETKVRASHEEEYKIYLACAGDSQGNDTGTGMPLKTFEEWVES